MFSFPIFSNLFVGIIIPTLSGEDKKTTFFQYGGHGVLNKQSIWLKKLRPPEAILIKFGNNSLMISD